MILNLASRHPQSKIKTVDEICPALGQKCPPPVQSLDGSCACPFSRLRINLARNRRNYLILLSKNYPRQEGGREMSGNLSAPQFAIT